MYHGKENTRKILVNNGRQEILKREKFCNLHGWVNLFQWEQHTACGSEPKNGASIEPLVMKKAA